uniref:Uncharacterized protein n=1 Tax=Nelumbo nucifera TaxID=4432 RepID=A0A822YS47_NELNU|nr:TPA_asm: hypothetical protein HUJ06_004879 [Nelumbo nucifera]
MMKRWHLLSKSKLNKPWILAFVALAALLAVVTLISSFSQSAQTSLYCSLAGSYRSGEAAAEYRTTPIQLLAILHYTTSPVVPQQSLVEISVSLDVLKSLSPCNFLVFGYDSLMWATFNPTGTTLFIEEDLCNRAACSLSPLSSHYRPATFYGDN